MRKKEGKVKKKEEKEEKEGGKRKKEGGSSLRWSLIHMWWVDEGFGRVCVYRYTFLL